MAGILRLCCSRNTVAKEGGADSGSGGVTSSSAQSRGDDASYLIPASISSGTAYGARWLWTTSADSTPRYKRFDLYIDTAPNAETTIYAIHGTSPYTIRFSVSLTSSRTLKLYSAGVQVGSASSALSTGTWYTVEVKIDQSGGSGSVVVEGKLDESVFATTSTDTNTNATAGITLGVNLYGAPETNTAGKWYFANVGVNDNTTSNNNSYIGKDSRFVHGMPNGEGTDTDGVATGGPTNRYECVDEENPNDATDYVDHQSNNDATTFDIESASTMGIDSGDTIQLVQVNARMTGDAVQSCSWQPKIYSGATSDTGTSVTLTTTTWYTNAEGEAREAKYSAALNPADSNAWEPADIDGLEIGFVSPDANPDVQFTNCWVTVEYTPTTSQSATASIVGITAAALGPAGVPSGSASRTAGQGQATGASLSASAQATGTVSRTADIAGITAAALGPAGSAVGTASRTSDLAAATAAAMSATAVAVGAATRATDQAEVAPAALSATATATGTVSRTAGIPEATGSALSASATVGGAAQNATADIAPATAAALGVNGQAAGAVQVTLGIAGIDVAAVSADRQVAGAAQATADIASATVATLSPAWSAIAYRTADLAGVDAASLGPTGTGAGTVARTADLAGVDVAALAPAGIAAGTVGRTADLVGVTVSALGPAAALGGLVDGIEERWTVPQGGRKWTVENKGRTWTVRDAGRKWSAND